MKNRFKKDKTKIPSVFDNFDNNGTPNQTNSNIVNNEKDVNQTFTSSPNNSVESQHTSNNATFFEKFEKSKKDFARDKKQQTTLARKSLLGKYRALGLSTKLNDHVFLKKSWLLFIGLGIFALAYSIVVIVFLSPYFNGSAGANKWSFVDLNLWMTQLSVVCSGISIGIVTIPYIYLLASWFVGINRTYRSVGFFIFNWTSLVIAIICVILTICTSSIIFNFVINFRPIIS